MKKMPSLFVLMLLIFSSARSQTLFTYGTTPVSKEEFLKAFNKNPDTTGPRSQKLKEYLDLYINFKLKLQAAKDEHLDNGADFKYEADNFKTQLTENYINDQANINGLVHEAFERSQYDIDLSQVFVEVKDGDDTAAAFNKITQAYNALKSGKSFAETATAYSSDEATANTQGHIGYITVFSLPYEIETLVYGLKPGSYSRIYRSIAGYHIFYCNGRRPAVGKRKIQQILIATPDVFTEAEKTSAAKLADSVYAELQKGASFDKMIQLYSAPNNNYEPTNTIEVGVGQYGSSFEKQVFALAKPGDISKPFQTDYGYNIIKLVDALPVSKDSTDVLTRAAMQEKIEADDRLASKRAELVQQWMQTLHYKKYPYNAGDLWAYTDSSLRKHEPVAQVRSISKSTVIGSFENEKITAGDWATYYIGIRQATPYARVNHPAEMKEFLDRYCDRYFREHIEKYYPPIASQLKEFNEANMLFAVMDKHVWTKAAEDTTGLENYYNTHKGQYIWQPGVSALIVTSASKDILDSIALQLKQNPSNWHNIVDQYSNMAQADSSRFEKDQLPVQQHIPSEKGFITAPEKNEAGDAYTLVYVFEVFDQPGQRSFDDARGMVINDYQQVLEQKWITELKKKYPVKVNDAVVKTL